MSVQLRIRCAVPMRQHKALQLAAIGVLGVLMQSCGAITAASLRGPDPSDATAQVPPTSYRPLAASYVSQRPVEPRPWREQNERVAPAPKR